MCGTEKSVSLCEVVDFVERGQKVYGCDRANSVSDDLRSSSRRDDGSVLRRVKCK